MRVARHSQGRTRWLTPRMPTHWGLFAARYNETMFKVFAEVFNCIPLAACIAGKVLVVHGGLFTRDGVKLSELRAIDRFRQPGSDGNVLNTKTVRALGRRALPSLTDQATVCGNSIELEHRHAQASCPTCSGLTLRSW